MKIFGQVQTTVLPNGFTVVTDYQPQSRVLYAQIAVLAGGYHDKRDCLGTAHFLEHMWTYSREGMTSAAYTDFLLDTALRGKTNFSTSGDMTRAHSSGSPDKIKAWLDIVGDMIGNMAFTQEDVEKERGAILQEMGPKTAGRELQQYFSHMKGLFGGQVIAGSTGGTVEHLSRISCDDLKAFYHQHYLGKNMLMVVSGPMTHDEAVAFADAKFAHLPEGQRNLHVCGRFMPSDVFWSESEKNGTSTDVEVRFNAEEFIGENSANLNIICNWLSAKLYQEVRQKRGLAYYAGAHVKSSGFHDGRIGLYAGINPHNIDALFDVTKDMFSHSLASFGIDFALTKDRYVQGFYEYLAHTYDTAVTRGDYILYQLRKYGEINEPYEFFESRLAKASAEKAVHVFETIFSRTPSMMYVGDVSSVKLPSGPEVADMIGLKGMADTGRTATATAAAKAFKLS